MLYNVEYEEDTLDWVLHISNYRVAPVLLSDSCSNRSDFCGTGTGKRVGGRVVFQSCRSVAKICIHPAWPHQHNGRPARHHWSYTHWNHLRPHQRLVSLLTTTAASSDATEVEAYGNLLASRLHEAEARHLVQFLVSLAAF